MNSTLKSLLFWIGLVVIGALIWQFSSNIQKSEELVTFSEFMDKVDSQKIAEVTISGNEITAKPTLTDAANKTGYRTFAPDYPDLVKELRDKKVAIAATREATTPWTTLLLAYAPIAL